MTSSADAVRSTPHHSTPGLIQQRYDGSGRDDLRVAHLEHTAARSDGRPLRRIWPSDQLTRQPAASLRRVAVVASVSTAWPLTAV